MVAYENVAKTARAVERIGVIECDVVFLDQMWVAHVRKVSPGSKLVRYRVWVKFGLSRMRRSVSMKEMVREGKGCRTV